MLIIFGDKFLEMKKFLLAILGVAVIYSTSAQVSITASDMPVNGDTLRYSTAAPIGTGIDLNDTGANVTWSYDSLDYLVQRVDSYKTAVQVNATYGFTISASAYGYKIADTLTPGGGSLPISITDVYNFFNIKTGPSRFITEAFAANISGLPVPANYQDEDELYFFPLAYGNPEDSSDFSLDINLQTVGSWKQDGYRKTKVDGWGTITTPYYTTPQNCIRVRSEIDATDSFQVSPLPSIGIARRSVDYKWLIPGEHYPALWVTTTIIGGNETITAVRYRDKYRQPRLSVEERAKEVLTNVSVYPNPAYDEVNIVIPSNTDHYIVELFNVEGKMLHSQKNNNSIDVSNLPTGNYIIRFTNDQGYGYGHFMKK